MKKLLARSLVVWVSVLAMTRQEYNDLRGWDLPENENGDDPGYLIEDPAGEKNTPQFDGYIQWLPQAEFERKFNIDELDSEQQIEKEIQDKGLNAPRLTPDHINSKVKVIRYLTGDITPAYVADGYENDRSTACLTICILTLENGFTVTGESACASPENFDKLIGQKIAYENARDKIWMLEGYLLKEKLHQAQLDNQF